MNIGGTDVSAANFLLDTFLLWLECTIQMVSTINKNGIIFQRIKTFRHIRYDKVTRCEGANCKNKLNT